MEKKPIEAHFFRNGFNLILRKMKLTLLLSFLFLISAYGKSLSQTTKLSLNLQNVSVQEVVKQIEDLTEFNFIYQDEVFIKGQKISIKANEAPIDSVMQQLSDQASVQYRIFDRQIVILKGDQKDQPGAFPAGANAEQKKEISGTVKDNNGQPLPGVTVSVKGTTTGTITDASGQFRLSIPVDAKILMFTFIGMKPVEIAIGGKTTFNISMEVQETKLNDFVVTGMFTKRAESYTGAATTVTARELQSFGNRNLITSLRNIDPSFNIIESNLFGSDPNRLPEIQIRGNSSLPNVTQLQDQTRVGLNTPLVILDGFESSLQRLLDMNENEVESITTLKDASATAIYGSRGANGIIVITTKTPTPGKLRITLRSDGNLEMPDLTGYSLLEARDKLELERLVGLYDNARAENDVPLKRYYNYLLNEVNSGVNTYWLSKPLRSAIGQRHNIRLEGGDNTFRYSASAQFNDIQGVMKESFRRTFNGTINLTYIYKNVRFTNSLMIGLGNTANSPYGTFSDYVRMNPYWRAYDDNGNVIKQMGYPGNTDYSNRWNPLPTNPLYNATLNTYDLSNSTTITNNFSVEFNLFKDLKVRTRLGLTKGNNQSDRFKPADHTDFANYAEADFFRKGSYAYGTGSTFNYDGSINLSYNRVFGNKHTVYAGVDYNIRQNQSSAYSFLAEGFLNSNLDFLSAALQYAQAGKPGGSEGLSRSVGITSNVNYTYDNRYMADFSLRADGNSQFGTKNRFAPFWSAGLGWNLHNESFLKGNNLINRLKIRGSIGITGSQNFSSYQALSTYRYYTDDRYFNWMGNRLLGLGNDALKWEQKTKFNVGFESQLLNNRLSLVADVYIDRTKDNVSSLNLPLSNGFSSYIENIGNVENRGFELKATAFIIRNLGKGFTWSVTGAMINNNNKIVKISKALKDAQVATEKAGGSNPNMLFREGFSTNTIWVVPSLGIDPSTGKELYLKKDGTPTYTWSSLDLTACGISEPKYLGNFSSMFRYKTLSVNLSFGYRFGGQLYNSTLIDKVENANYQYNVDSRVYDNRWQKPGDNAAFKGLLVTTPTQMTSRFVQNERTLTCQNVNVQYDIRNKNFTKMLGIETLSFSGSIADLFYISSVKRERGISYPFSRQLSLSVSAMF